MYVLVEENKNLEFPSFIQCPIGEICLQTTMAERQNDAMLYRQCWLTEMLALK